MGVFDKIGSFFNRDKMTVTKIIDLLNRGNPLISVGRDLYNIPEVRTAINFVAEKVASIPFFHVIEDVDGNVSLVNDSINRVLTVRANPKQCPQVYMTQVVTRLLLANNVFILQEWDEITGKLRARYPLPFSLFDFAQDENGKLLILFPEWNNAVFYYEDVLHYQRFPTFKGGTPTQATGNYVQIVSTLQGQAVKDSENSNRIAALLQMKTALKGPAMKAKLEEFKELFLTAENSTGFGMIGGDYEVHDLKADKTPLNKDVLESIVSYLYNYFGVSKEIINGTATEIQHQQFINNTIKSIVWQVEEEDTYKTFTEREIGFNHKIASELLDIEVATLTSKTMFLKEMSFAGIINRNEGRRRIYLRKGPPELDEFQTSKNFQQALPPGNYIVEPPKGGDNADGTESTEPQV